MLSTNDYVPRKSTKYFLSPLEIYIERSLIYESVTQQRINFFHNFFIIVASLFKEILF